MIESAGLNTIILGFRVPAFGQIDPSAEYYGGSIKISKKNGGSKFYRLEWIEHEGRIVRYERAEYDRGGRPKECEFVDKRQANEIKQRFPPDEGLEYDERSVYGGPLKTAERYIHYKFSEWENGVPSKPGPRTLMSSAASALHFEFLLIIYRRQSPSVASSASIKLPVF
ncbi:hypothetical protein R1flu_021304 [Riccia fluitans]|uniref:Uncharacterized protein n=1 Tax=Riccia fluitans TaxID=41844 RepID=A0ABD1ZP03_9MARC